MISIQGKGVSEVYFGNLPASAVYLGVKVVWEKGSWTDPVQSGDILTIVQAFSATQTNDTLEVT